jgi:protein-tyrosine phosphatase
LADEIRSWRQTGVDVVVSTLEPEEANELDLRTEPEVCEAIGIEYISFPIADRSTPPSLTATMKLARQLEAGLLAGKRIAIHCRAGIGRSALLAACLLVLAGVDWEAAWERIRSARGCPVPDTTEQRNWLARFARDAFTAVTAKEEKRTSYG